MINNINTESCRRNHNLCFIISNSVEPFYLSKLFSDTVSLTYKKTKQLFSCHFYKTRAHMFIVTKTLHQYTSTLRQYLKSFL